MKQKTEVATGQPRLFQQFSAGCAAVDVSDAGTRWGRPARRLGGGRQNHPLRSLHQYGALALRAHTQQPIDYTGSLLLHFRCIFSR